jgi:hypothetical protein
MKSLTKPIIAAIFSAVIAAPSLAAPLESLVDEIKRDLIITKPNDRLPHLLTAS